MPNPAAIPAWLTQMDADEAAQQQPQSMAPPNQSPPAAVPEWLKALDAQQSSVPSWYTPETAAASSRDQVDPAPDSLPSWYTPETPETPDESAAPAKPPQDPSAAMNFLSGLLRVPGAILGAPAVIKHFGNWANAQVLNAANGFSTNFTGADLDKNDPLMKVLPTSQSVDNAVFGATGVKPYEPISPLGKVGQAVTTGLGAGLVDPLAVAGDISRGVSAVRTIANTGFNAVKTGLASGAANAVDQVAPNNPGLDAGAAFLTHAGLGGVGQLAKFGGGVAADTTRQVFAPTKQGEIEAGRVLTNVNNTQPGLARPLDSDLAGAQSDVNAATGDIGAGLQPWQAGAQLRTGLQTRVDRLKAARAASVDPAYDAFRAQPALPAAALQPFMQSPSFKSALGAANAAVLDEGGEPLTKYFDLGDDGNTPSYLSGEAIPPDVLLRVKSQLGEAVNNAPAGSGTQRTATILNNRFGNFLEDQYPATEDFPGYAAINQGYADASRPLDPMSYGPVEKVLDADKQFGQSRYTFPDERIPDLFLRSNATRTDLNQLTSAFGGDKGAAMGALEQHLAGVAQSAVQPDGTLDSGAFDKAMQPYQKSLGNLSMWFPNLAAKFATAKAAQGTLDTLQAQRGLADDISGGALRDDTGMVTGQSFGKWLGANKDAIAKTQSPGAVMRLQSMANALQGAQPGELADMVKSELLPAAAGAATFGLEGGVLGTLLHKTTQTMFGGLDAKRQAAFSTALERATLDPVYASKLAANAAKRGQGISPARALVQAIAATPIATNAGAPAQ